MKTIISNSYISVIINHKGAELISVQKVDTKREFFWEGNPIFWGKHSPILFPIVGTLKNNSYNYNSKRYELSRHGFARDMDFTVKSQSENEVVFSLLSDETTLESYPFDFELQVTYLLNANELIITYEIFNNDSKTLPFSIGGHPAFALNGEFENYSLKFEDNENLNSYLLETDLLSDETIPINLKEKLLPLTYSLFENDALIFKTLKSKEIQILENKIPFLNFKFKDFPNFGIWTKMNAPFICLEPWAGYADTLESNGNIMEKEGIQKLESNESKRYTFSMEFL